MDVTFYEDTCYFDTPLQGEKVFFEEMSVNVDQFPVDGSAREDPIVVNAGEDPVLPKIQVFRNAEEEPVEDAPDDQSGNVRPVGEEESGNSS
jgi:hypothetical protein